MKFVQHNNIKNILCSIYLHWLLLYLKLNPWTFKHKYKFVEVNHINQQQARNSSERKKNK